MSMDEQQKQEINRRLQIYGLLKNDTKFAAAAKAYWENPSSDKLVMRDVFPLVNPIFKENCKDLRTVEQIEFAKYFLDEAVSLGAIEELYRDPEVTEIIVEDFLNVFFIKDGAEDAGPTFFTSEEHMIQVVNRLLQPTGCSLSALTPQLEVRLEDGSLLTAALAGNGSEAAHFKIVRKPPRPRPQLRIVRDEGS